MAEKGTIKNLTATELIKQSKKLDARTEHTIILEIEQGIDEGTNTPIFEEVPYKVKVDNIFRQTKQHKVMEDLIEFFNEGNERAEILDVATPYTSLLIVKHFTSIAVPDDIDEAIELLNAMVDLKLLGKVVEVLPENQVIKMYESLSSAVSRMNANIDEVVKEAKDLEGQLESEQVKELVQDGEE